MPGEEVAQVKHSGQYRYTNNVLSILDLISSAFVDIHVQIDLTVLMYMHL
jgi:hypothetical protein